MATKKQNTPAAAGAALVLCSGSFDGLRPVSAGVVVEGVPEAVLSNNAHWLDGHPDAVAHAMAEGATVVQYDAE